MTKIGTTPEQSEELVKAGLDINTADMYWELELDKPKLVIGNYRLHNQCREDKDYKKLTNSVISPAWSLSALLTLIPLEYKLEKTYLDQSGYSTFAVDCHPIFDIRTYEREEPVDSTVELVLRLLKDKIL